MRIAVYGNSYKEEHLEELSALFELLSTHNAWVEIEASFYRYLCKVLPTPPKINDVIEGDDFSAAIALSLGGDGTFLRTAQWVGKKEIPILGINTGHLGYLADVRISDVGKCLECVFNGNHRIDSRTMIEVDCAETDVDGWPYALNEVAILKQDTSSMIDMEARIGDALLANYRGDGLIVSTPTGSTGYNLSVGGPILEPSAPVWAISPIAAHSLTMRPLVVSDDSVFTVTTHSRSDAYRLSLDGRSVSLAAGTTVMMRRAPFVTKVIQSQDHHFSDTLRDKLLWGIDKR
ncbi:NAD kinase [uncultured Muribaculum sp.]|uniref:NAD kinase n=1 Tax=uncultured Muribaculum sp. TaxID=1918613 RepID=UPI002674FCCE|nr:NAD kinase [uncultured Muribaculum sp.]